MSHHYVVACDHCGGGRHPAEYSHEGRYGEGPIYAVVCTADWLTEYVTTEALERVSGPELLDVAELGLRGGR